MNDDDNMIKASLKGFFSELSRKTAGACIATLQLTAATTGKGFCIHTESSLAQGLSYSQDQELKQVLCVGVSH